MRPTRWTRHDASRCATPCGRGGRPVSSASTPLRGGDEGSRAWPAPALAALPGADRHPTRWAHYTIATIRNIQADTDATEAHTRRARAVNAISASTRKPRIATMRATALVFQGCLTEALASAETAHRLARARAHAFDEIDALFTIIHVRCYLGEVVPAELVRRCLDLAAAIANR